jgi:hypothetical protein
VQSSPAVAGGRVYVGSDDAKVYCLDASTGAKIWSYLTGDRVVSSPAIVDGVVYIGSYDGKVYAFGLGVIPEFPTTIASTLTLIIISITMIYAKKKFSLSNSTYNSAR